MKVADVFTAPRGNVVPSIMAFPQFDADGVAKRLRLKEQAVERAQRGQPDSTDTSFDIVEQQIVGEVEKQGQIDFNEYLECQKSYADRMSSAGIQSLALQIGSTTDAATTDFERKTRVGTGELYALRRDLVDSEKELGQFREQHGLTRPARYQTAKSLKLGVLIFILAVESVLNGYFFAKGNEFGYVGGLGQALIIAALNVVLGFSIGRLVLPWLSHKSTAAPAAAALGALLYLAAMVGFNLAVAHFRTAVIADPFNASTTAFQTLRSQPFAIADLQSWALFFVGCFFSLVAAGDGIIWDDPYPGYGPRTRENLDALDNYTARKDELLTELDEVKKSAELKLDDLARQIENRSREFAHVQLKSQSLKLAMQQHFANLDTAANTMLRFYRDENERHRTTTVPAHFMDRWQHQWPAVEGPAATDKSKVDSDVANALSTIPRNRQQLHDAYRIALSHYQKIDDLIAENTAS